MRIVGFLGLVGMLIWLAVAGAVIWFVLSLGTSVIKVATKQCGQATYGLEQFHVQGDWFCPVETPEHDE